MVADFAHELALQVTRTFGPQGANVPEVVHRSFDVEDFLRALDLGQPLLDRRRLCLQPGVVDLSHYVKLPPSLLLPLQGYALFGGVVTRLTGTKFSDDFTEVLRR